MRRNMWTGHAGPASAEFGSQSTAAPSDADGDTATSGAHSGKHALPLDEVGDGYVDLADLPGFEKEEIDLTFDDGVLTITGTHEVSDEHTARNRTVHESIRVPGEVRVDDVTESYRNGVLEVPLPVDDVAETGHRIDIE